MDKKHANVERATRNSLGNKNTLAVNSKLNHAVMFLTSYITLLCTRIKNEESSVGDFLRL